MDVKIPLQTVYRGPRSAQPRAYLAGHGRLRIRGDAGVLEPLPSPAMQRLIEMNRYYEDAWIKQEAQ